MNNILRDADGRVIKKNPTTYRPPERGPSDAEIRRLLARNIRGFETTSRPDLDDWLRDLIARPFGVVRCAREMGQTVGWVRWRAEHLGLVFKV